MSENSRGIFLTHTVHLS